MAASKPNKKKIALAALQERLRAISTSALQACDAVEACEDGWAEDVSEFLETIDADMEVAYNRLEPYLEDEDGEEDEEHPNAED